MKTNLLLFTFLLCALSFGQIGYSQTPTTLAAGDIAIILNRANSPDQFAFVTFVDLEASTVIYFTDCGTDENGFKANYSGSEGVLAYTVPTSGHPAGTIVRFEHNGDDLNPDAKFDRFNNSRFTGFVGFASSGDQIIIFQEAGFPGGSSDAGNNPIFIFASNNASSVFDGNKDDSNQTGLPVGLQNTTAPLTAMGFGAGAGPEDEVDNSIYNGSYTFTSIEEAKLALTDLANYYTTSVLPAQDDSTYADADAAIPSALNIGTLSNEEFNLSNEVSVFPNPSNGIITIKNTGISLEKVTISDINGRLISAINLNGVTNDKTIDLSSELTSGIYFMSITSENASTVKKLIIK